MFETELTPISARAQCSRRHAIKVFAAAAGGALLGDGLCRGFAAQPWGEPETAVSIGPETDPLAVRSTSAYHTGVRQGAPTLALDSSHDCLWTTWTREHEGTEEIALKSFSISEERWSDATPVSRRDRGEPLASGDSQIVAVEDRLVVVWPAWSPAGWALLARSYDPARQALGSIEQVSELASTYGIHWRASATAVGPRVLVVWETTGHVRSRFRIVGRFLDRDGRPTDRTFPISLESAGDCHRPSVVASPRHGEFAVAYDQVDGAGTQNVQLVLMDAASGATSLRTAVTNHPASDIAPALAYSADGQFLWVAWQSNRRGADGWDILQWVQLRTLDRAGMTWQCPAGPQPPHLEETRGTVQGFEFPRLAVAPSGCVCVLGRPSHSFCLQYVGREGWSPLYRLPKDGWGGRGRLLHGLFDADGALWVTRRDLGTNVLQRIDGFNEGSDAPPLQPFAGTAAPTDLRLAGVSSPFDWTVVPRGGRRRVASSSDGYEGLSLYFGDVHGHSWQSDGMGDPEQSYLRARDVFADDFHALTDHDRFVGKRVADTQWEAQKDLADHYNAPGKFVAIYGQEWTTPRTGRPHGWGHMNVYTTDRRIPLLDHGDPRYRDLPDLYKILRAYNAIAIPHHIGWTGVPWDALDPQLTPAVEICSVHGAFEYEGNGPIRHRGGLRGCFVRDGYRTGLKFGLVGGSDQHGLIWHHGVCWKRNAYRAGLTGVWASDLTRVAILDAIRQRRTFATTGAKLLLRFTLEGTPMGAIVTVDGPPTLRVDVAVPPDQGHLGWLQIIRNGSVIHQYGGEGQRSRYTYVDDASPASETSHYYLRVQLADGNLAWSSPIWATRT